MGEVIESEVTPSRRSVGEGKLGRWERPPLLGCLTELVAVVCNGACRLAAMGNAPLDGPEAWGSFL